MKTTREFTLNDLARGVRPGIQETVKAFEDAGHDQGRLGAEAFIRAIVDQRLQRLAKREQARIRAKQLRAAQGRRQGEAEGPAAGLGQTVHLVIEVRHVFVQAKAGSVAA